MAANNVEVPEKRAAFAVVAILYVGAIPGKGRKPELWVEVPKTSNTRAACARHSF